MITNQSEAHGYHYRLAPRGYVFSVFAGRANGARTLVRSKIGRRRSLEISKRGSALPGFLRDKSRAPGEFLVGALNRYRVALCEAWGEAEAWTDPTPCRIQFGDTADCKSALQPQRPSHEYHGDRR